MGDEVAAIDEITGERVWRDVTTRFSRVAPGVVSVEVEDADGNRDTFKTTPEHPFHVEGWDGTITTEGLHAALGVPSIEEHILLPSEEKTKFGDWVKATSRRRFACLPVNGTH